MPDWNRPFLGFLGATLLFAVTAALAIGAGDTSFGCLNAIFALLCALVSHDAARRSADSRDRWSRLRGDAP